MSTLWIERKELRVRLNNYELDVIQKLQKEAKDRGKELHIGPYLEEIFHLRFEEVFGDL